MLAYYVVWQMRRKLAPLLFEDHDRPAATASRASPVAPAEVSPAARAKARARKTDDGEPVHSFRTLLADLATLTHNTMRLGRGPALYRLVTAHGHSATRLRPPRHRPRAVGRAHPDIVAHLSANQDLTSPKPRKFGLTNSRHRSGRAEAARGRRDRRRERASDVRPLTPPLSPGRGRTPEPTLSRRERVRAGASG